MTWVIAFIAFTIQQVAVIAWIKALSDEVEKLRTDLRNIGSDL